MGRLSTYIVLAVLFALHAYAALPVSLSDQGTNVINKSSGQTINGDLTVLIYDAATAGTLVYNETFASAIANGSWNVMLGENSSNPLNLEFGREYFKDYLIAGEDANFTNLTGGQVDRQFFFSPLGDILFDNYPANLTVDGRIGIGTATPRETLDVNGSVRFSDEFLWNSSVERLALHGNETTVTIGGIGTLSAILTAHDEGDNPANLLVHKYTNASGEGGSITGAKARGTQANPLIVANEDDIVAFTGAGFDGTDYQFLAQMLFEVDGTPSNGSDMPGRIVFRTTPDGAGFFEERMRIDNAGNVGIGTDSPSRLLDVAGNGSFAGLSLTVNGTEVCLSNGTNCVSVGNATLETGWTDDGAVVRLTNITDTVGVGTTSPFAKLDVLENGSSGFNTSIEGFLERSSGTIGSRLIGVRGNYITQGTHSTTGGFDSGAGTFAVKGRTLHNSTGTINESFGTIGTVETVSGTTTGTIGTSIGAGGQTLNYGDGNITAAVGIAGRVRNLGSGTITNAVGIFIPSTNNTGSGTITTNFGGLIQNQTAGTTNIGLYIIGASSASLWTGTGDVFHEDNLIVGGGLGTGETLDNTGFTLDGDDLFVVDSAGIEGAIYTDANLTVGASTTYADGNISSTGSTDMNIDLGGDDLIIQDRVFIDRDDFNAVQVATDGNTSIVFEVDTINERVAVGTDSPGNKFVVRENNVGTGTERIATDSEEDITSGEQNVSAFGVQGKLRISGSANATGVDNNDVAGIIGLGEQASTGSITEIIGTVGSVFTTAAGPITTAAGLGGRIQLFAPTTITNASGLLIKSAANIGGGTITNNFGLKVDDQTAGTNDYGIYVAGADNYSIWADSGDVRFDENVVIGGSTSVVETIANGNFSLGGDDLFVAGELGVEGNIYSDGIVFANNVSSNSPLRLQTSGTTRIYINDSNGFVGIGTETPSQQLDVSGNLEVSGNITEGGTPVCLSNGTNCVSSGGGSLDDAYNNGSSIQVDSTDVVWNLTSTQDFHIADTGTNFMSFNDDSTINYDYSGGSIGASSTVTAIDIDTSVGGMGASSTYTGLNIDAAVSGSRDGNLVAEKITATTAGTTGIGDLLKGTEITIGAIDNNGDTRGLEIIQPATVGGFSSRVDDYLRLTKIGGTIDGNFITISGGADGDTGLNLGATDIEGTTSAITFSNFVVEADGDVGIGTTSPSTALHVVGDGNITGTLYASNVSSNSPLRLQTSGTTRIYINDSNGFVGIGTETPTATLHVDNSPGEPTARIGNGGTTATAQNAIAIGTGAEATAIQSIAMGTNSEATAVRAIAIGNLVTATGLDATALGRRIEANGQFSIAMGLDDTFYNVTQDNTLSIMGGQVGISTTSPNGTLHVAGNITVDQLAPAAATTVCRDGNNQLSTCTSSLAFKTDVTNLSDSELDTILDEMINTSIYSFKYAPDNPNRTRYGIIAEYAPNRIQLTDANGNPNVDLMSAQIGYTWAGIKALNRKIENLSVSSANDNNTFTRVHTGKFIISGTGTQTITGIPFQPDQIHFEGKSNVEAYDDDTQPASTNDNTKDNVAGSFSGYARNNGSAIKQQALSSSISGNSINLVGRYSTSNHAIAQKYTNKNGNDLGKTQASVVSFDATGFTLDVTEFTDPLVVIYTAYRGTEQAINATDVSSNGTLIKESVTDINFGSGLSVADDGDGSVTVNASGETSGWTDDGGTVRLTTLTDNVGIGTTNPQNKIDVSGNAVIGASYAGSNTAPSNGLLVEGSMGVGTTLPLAKLDVNDDIRIGGSSPTLTLTDTVTEYEAAINGTNFELRRDGNTALRILSGGTVEVDAFKIPTGAQNGSILTSDPNGQASWKQPNDAISVDCTTETSSGGGSATATCPAGYTITGGGCNGGFREIEQSYPDTDTSWHCDIQTGQSVTAYARCCRLN